MLVKVSCRRCSIGPVWTDDPQCFLGSACREPEGCSARLIAEDTADASPAAALADGISGEPRESRVDPSAFWARSPEAGAHLCHSFRSAGELVDLVVPYFREGLERGEKCVWVAGDCLPTEQARERLAASVGDLAGLEREGRIEIVDRLAWYRAADGFRPERVVDGWLAATRHARRRGFSGIRISGSVSTADAVIWPEVLRYEALFDQVIQSQPIVALCSYPETVFRPSDLLEHHELALVHDDDAWWQCTSAEQAARRLATPAD